MKEANPNIAKYFLRYSKNVILKNPRKTWKWKDLQVEEATPNIVKYFVKILKNILKIL